MSTSSLLTSLFHYKAWANDELFAQVARIDPLLHQSELHTAIRLMNHIHVVDRIFAAHLSGASHSFTASNTAETPSLEQLRTTVGQTDRWYIDKVAQCTPQELAEIIAFTFTDGSAARMSREEMLAHVITHGGYHRGAVGRILSQLSITPPRDVFSGYLHQAEPGRRSL
jgi:uncharacterized damage-inducible protein DinB